LKHLGAPVFVLFWVGSCLAEPLPSQILLKIPFFRDTTDQCGPATLAEILGFWGKAANPTLLRKEMYQAKLHGTLPMDLMLAAESHGLKTELVRGDVSQLQSELRAGRPVLAMLNFGFSFMPMDHYVVVTGFDENRRGFFVHSAGKENQFLSYKKFRQAWEKTDYWTMLARLPS
jgi:ABC-type bacteriocin/lantibiotic exporter with double-glycine peptidase domain